MLRDFINWVDKDKKIVVNDHENKRYFSRPLTFIEKEYTLDNNMNDINTWPKEKKDRESKSFKEFVEKRRAG